MNKQDAKGILDEVRELFSNSMSMFDLEEIIDCSDELTPEEKVWAKQNLYAEVYLNEGVLEAIESQPVRDIGDWIKETQESCL